jgi:hypothetical protein
VVAQDRWEVSRRYGVFTFPCAVLVDEDGLIAREIAGVDEIAALLAASAYTHTN